MTVEASRIPVLLDNLKVRLDIRLAALTVSESDTTLADVMVSTAPLKIDEALQSIEFAAEVTSDQEWATFGNLRQEEKGSLDGLVWVVMPGAGEGVVKEARDRAFLLLNTVAAELRERPGVWLTTQGSDSAVRVAHIANVRFNQDVLTSGRVARILFRIDWEVRLPINE